MVTTTAYRARQRRRRDPEYRLVAPIARWELTTDDNPIVIGVTFTDRTVPITFGMTVVRTDTTSNGLLFEIGGSARGIAAYLDGADLGFVAGTATGDTGVAVLAEDALPTVDQVYRIVCSCLTGSGKVRVWVDGRLVAIGQAVAGNFDVSGNTNWGHGGNGAIGRAEGAASSRVPLAQRATLTDATIIGPVLVYDGAIPVAGEW